MATRVICFVDGSSQQRLFNGVLHRPLARTDKTVVGHCEMLLSVLGINFVRKPKATSDMRT